MVAPMLRHWKINGTRIYIYIIYIYWFCVPFYPITSRDILWHPIISHHIPLYPISCSLPISHSRSIECFVRGHRQFPIRKQLLQPWRVRELSEAPLRRLLILYNFYICLSVWRLYKKENQPWSLGPQNFEYSLFIRLILLGFSKTEDLPWDLACRAEVPAVALPTCFGCQPVPPAWAGWPVANAATSARFEKQPSADDIMSQILMVKILHHATGSDLLGDHCQKRSGSPDT